MIHFALRLPVALLVAAVPAAPAAHLTLRQDAAAHTISVYRDNVPAPILTQNAKPDFRPYLHPIVSPDGKSVLTEFSPGHHKHQTGIYWGLTRVNGRDYFHNPANGYWRRISSEIIAEHGSTVQWSTVYHLLDEAGRPVMAETQTWTMRDTGDRYLLDLEWKGEGLVDLTVAKYDYGGLFVRMPWRAGLEGAVTNSNRQRNLLATGQRALWVDIGLKLEGRADQAHIAILDHPRNADYPLPWRVDGQMGAGPSRAISGNWKIARGKTETVRHQLVVYTGELNDIGMTEAWKAYTGENNDNVLWRLAKAEGLKATFLTGEQAAAKMTVAPGFEVKLAAAEPMMLSAPPAPMIWRLRSVTVPRVARLAVVPEATFTIKVSTAPPATPVTVQLCRLSWAPVKVAVRPLAIVTAWILLKLAALASTLAVKARVLVPVPPFTVSPAAASAALA